MLKMALIGLGTVNVSVALALKAVTDEIEIIAHEPDPIRLKRAQTLGAFDRSHWNLPGACAEAEIVLLDLPMDQMELTLKSLDSALQPGAVVIDTLPLKAPVMALAAQVTPALPFIGGHLVAPRLLEGIEPSADALQGALFYLVAPPDAAAASLDRAATLAEAVGARPCFIEAAEHDAIMVATSMLPLLSAAALMRVQRREPGWTDRAQGVSGELAAQAALLAGIDTASVATMAAANGEALARWLGIYGAELVRCGRRCWPPATLTPCAKPFPPPAMPLNRWGRIPMMPRPPAPRPSAVGASSCSGVLATCWANAAPRSDTSHNRVTARF